MKSIQTEVLVIGGGATGTGVLRDLAMRGFKAILVEQGDLTHGTTGRYHGLLHSGGRYAVKDPLAARECIEENRILRRIMPECIEDTGGFFVLTSWDDPEYAPRFLDGCQKAGIRVEEISIAQMLREEPLLNPQILRCFRVPDAAADSFLAADMNAASARQHEAQWLTYHQVASLIRSGDRIVGARCHDLVADEDLEIHADMVVNASGAWAGLITATAGLRVDIVAGKGVMVAMNHRIVNTVINRCKLPSDGDILVPIHTVSVIGTTDNKVDDPDHFAIEPWEVHLMLEEGDKLVPGFKQMRMLRAWAGVRPLYQESEVSDTRDVTRAFVLLDHLQRDGVSGLVTITSGKWTTYRKMAEVTVDLVCQQLGVQRPCRTHLEPLGGREHITHHTLGKPLSEVEKAQSYGRLVCECELATYDEVARAITENGAKTIDDVRRDVRLGMGPCQGGFCTYRVAGILHRLRQPPVEDTNVALRDFLQERWKGLLPILWGQQLRQERLDELIYLDVLNTEALPGPDESPLGPENYLPSKKESLKTTEKEPAIIPREMTAPDLETASKPNTSAATLGSVTQPDLLVVGAGLAGLFAGWRAARAGLRVQVIAKGWGAQYWGAGCVDAYGYTQDISSGVVENLRPALETLVKKQPDHPYALAGLDALESALYDLQQLCAQAGYPMLGSQKRNWMLPSALGTPRPTCLAPETMIAGDLRSTESMLIVGFGQSEVSYPQTIASLNDFFPELIAANINKQGVPARALIVDLASLRSRRFTTGRTLAESFTKPEFREELVQALQPALEGFGRVGFPAVLGFETAVEIQRDLQEQLGCPVFEIPSLPASIPGIRLSRILVNAIEAAGGRVWEGMQAVEAEIRDGQVAVIWSEAASRRKANRARRFLLATGGLLGGGVHTAYDGCIKETIFNLPLQMPGSRAEWFQRRFLDPKGHAVYGSGLRVNSNFRPVDNSGAVLYPNLFAAGSIIGGCDPLRERSLDGIALATAFAAVQNSIRS